MSKDLQKVDELAEQAVEFFEMVSSDQMTAKEIAAKYNIPLRTVYYRINQGRDIAYDAIKKIGHKKFVDIYNKYEWIWEQAKIQWDESHNVLFLKEMQAVLGNMRKMLSVDEAPKAPVNEEGKAVSDKLIFIMSDEQYRQKEKETQIIEGTFDQVTDSTNGLLPQPENEVKSEDKGEKND